MGNLPSGLSDQIADDEDLARFLTSSKYFNKHQMVVKAVAFLPSPADLETSVFRHGKEPSKSLWKIGTETVKNTERSLHGVAIIKASMVRATALDVFADEPPPRHAAIRKWPINNDIELQKAQQKERALMLASAAGEPLLAK